MDFETITKLVNAGYSKAEIDAMQAEKEAGEKGNESAGTAGNVESAGAGENVENTTPQKPIEVNTDAAIKALTDTVNALTNTVKAMQEKNVAGASGGKPEKSTIDETLKSFIDAL